MNALRVRRVELGWTKLALSALIGISVATLHRAEQGKWIRPSLRKKIESALAVAAPPRKPQGFAALPPQRMREICQQGAAAQAPQRHRWTAESAQEAGRKGGLAVSQNREHMRELGRRGGLAKVSKKT